MSKKVAQYLRICKTMSYAPFEVARTCQHAGFYGATDNQIVAIKRMAAMHPNNSYVQNEFKAMISELG